LTSFRSFDGRVWQCQKAILGRSHQVKAFILGLVQTSDGLGKARSIAEGE
jgi:hypothetical protein